jgi:hypothetical protein
MSHETPKRRYRVLDLGLGALCLALVLACLLAIPIPAPSVEETIASPSSKQSGELRAAPVAQEWKMVVMSGGPAVYTACVEGDRLFAMNKLAWKNTAGLWPDVSLAVSPGACRARSKH